MTWHPIWPVITDSVKANGPTGVANTNYIKGTMGGVALNINLAGTTDHFWDVAAGLNGHHRFVKLPDFTTDPLIDDTSIRGVMYAKAPSVTATRIELFYKNGSATYQLSPSFLSGTSGAISGSYVDIVVVPANVYGDIFMWATADGTAAESRYRTASGFFRSNATTVSSWGVAVDTQGDGDFTNALKFGNGSDTNALNIRARAADATTGLTWNYRITYRAI
jgi:hypothetical protein